MTSVIEGPRKTLRDWDDRHPYAYPAAWGLFVAVFAAILYAITGGGVRERFGMVVFWAVTGFFVTIAARANRRRRREDPKP